MVDLAVLQSVSYIAGALGVCVAAFYYVMTLRVQQANMKANLETRQTQLFMDIWKVFSSKEYQKDREQMFATWQFTRARRFTTLVINSPPSSNCVKAVTTRILQ